VIVPAMLGITSATQQQNVPQVRIVPRLEFYIVEVISEHVPVQAAVDPALHAGCDIGVDNLATLASDQPGFIPRIVNGRPVKSSNQYYNKRRAALQRQLGHKGTGHRLERLTTRRTRRIDHYLHTASRRLVDLLVAEGIGTLVIGKNPLWKQEVRLGWRTNQQFVCIPHARCIALLTSKAELVGIQVRVSEESSTSKASFLDADPLPVYDADRHQPPAFSGTRVQRSG
jgi:putative transposase